MGRTIYLRHFELELPWQDPQFYWLPDPRHGDGEPELYRFAGDKLEYPRKSVINRIVPSSTQFKNGALVAGLVLGQSPEEIPDCYKHGQELPAKFSVIDQFEDRHSADVILYLDRSAQMRPRRPKEPRRSLFSQPDSEGALIAPYGVPRHPAEEYLQRTRELLSAGSSAVGSPK